MTANPSTIFSTNSGINEINLKTLINELLIILSERERDIIVKRYGIGQEKTKSTLALIGSKYNITRERVRQMEKTALDKLRRTAERTTLHIIGEFAYNTLKKKGGIMNERDMTILVSEVLKNSKQLDSNTITLAINLEKRLFRFNNTIKYKPYWRTDDLSENKIREISSKTTNLIKKNKNGFVEIENICDELKKQFPELSTNTFKQIFAIDKDLKISSDIIGLTTDKNINPKTLRDKIYYILRKGKKPMHFTEIANTIIKEKFDGKVINTQAVHNECIRNDEFVLIGRGIYALKEWGYKVGTVKNIILDVLKDGKARSRDEILEKVKAQRLVKDVTIILNLKDNDIKRVGRDQYALAKKK